MPRAVGIVKQERGRRGFAYPKAHNLNSIKKLKATKQAPKPLILLSPSLILGSTMKFALFAMALTLFASAFGPFCEAVPDEGSIGKGLMEEFFDVTITPKCDGVDMDSLSAPEKAYVSDVLETTYNQVHSIFVSSDCSCQNEGRVFTQRIH